MKKMESSLGQKLTLFLVKKKNVECWKGIDLIFVVYVEWRQKYHTVF